MTREAEMPKGTTRDELLLMAWTEALGPVLALLDAHRRDLFRHEVQRFIATSRFDSKGAAVALGPMCDMLIQAARAAAQPAAIHTTRAIEDVGELVVLCEHILAEWIGAIDSIQTEGSSLCASDGMSGEVFFGKRLGGTGRPGSASRAPGLPEGRFEHESEEG